MKEAEKYCKNSKFYKYVDTYPHRFYPSYWMKFEEYYHEHEGTLNRIYEIYWIYKDTLFTGSRYSIKQFLKNFLEHIYHTEQLEIPHNPNEIVVNLKNKDEIINQWNETLGID